MKRCWDVACFRIAGTLSPNNNKIKMASNIPRAPPIDYRPSTASTLQVTVTPASKLTFTVLPNKSIRATLTLTNEGNSPHVAFKVKTTQPKRYLVKPNQGVLDVGETRDIQVIISPDKQQAVVDAWQKGDKQELNDKFQVVLVGIAESVYQAVQSISEAREQTDELAALWGRIKKEDMNTRKLDVEFALPEDGPRAPATAVPPPSAPVSMDASGSRRQQEATTRGGKQDTINVAEEMALLRKKYDDLVTFTVTLTGERDTLLSQLDTIKMDLRRTLNAQAEVEGEAGKRDSLSAHKRRSSRSSPFGSTAIPGVGPNGTQQLVTDPTLARDKRRTNAGGGAGKGSEGRGFSLLTLALAGVTTFMLGKASITRL